MIDEQDVKDWEQLPLVSSVLTSPHMGAWLYYRDQRRDKRVRADVIDEYMNNLCDKCIQTPNECCNLECPFADDECQIGKVAEQLKEQK